MKQRRSHEGWHTEGDSIKTVKNKKNKTFIALIQFLFNYVS